MYPSKAAKLCIGKDSEAKLLAQNGAYRLIAAQKNWLNIA